MPMIKQVWLWDKNIYETLYRVVKEYAKKNFGFLTNPVICDRWSTMVQLSPEEIWWKPGKRSVTCRSFQ